MREKIEEWIKHAKLEGAAHVSIPIAVMEELVNIAFYGPSPDQVTNALLYVTGAQPQEHILQFFGFKHLPLNLAVVSKRFAEMAVLIVEKLPRNPERTVALRKLLESKDAAVRARMAQ